MKDIAFTADISARTGGPGDCLLEIAEHAATIAAHKAKMTTLDEMRTFGAWALAELTKYGILAPPGGDQEIMSFS